MHWENGWHQEQLVGQWITGLIVVCPLLSYPASDHDSRFTNHELINIQEREPDYVLVAKGRIVKKTINYGILQLPIVAIWRVKARI
ncbi:hypothetical protein MNBD_GAMMA26-423 [hydrothermal vent metagenome]|uniref:Uncharacterized protein n=1 Tax=hydrothermal vent metagenome TaxID=652676 RepID=A0A3B1AL83_9ZZZZ